MGKLSRKLYNIIMWYLGHMFTAGFTLRNYVNYKIVHATSDTIWTYLSILLYDLTSVPTTPSFHTSTCTTLDSKLYFSLNCQYI